MALLLPGELAWYVTGRFYERADHSLADYGYFLHLAGIEADLFDGKPSERTAHFTFAAEPFTARGVSNGDLKLGLDPAGDFSVYLQPEPAGDFDDPQSFARGQRIATFRRVSVVVGTTLEAGKPHDTHPLLSSNVFSARLLISNPFEFAGRRYDLRHQIGKGVTQFGTAAAASLPKEQTPKDYASVVAFSGSALALIG
ncbi:hypothetical protein [Tahibacter caeni]|uniref:hypothetical protein n=1 Tax=Tahibacter caeni TaxID=1453545 RepID=UPI002149607E|nr:hypothetical protein [Tahibacter caeni]